VLIENGKSINSGDIFNIIKNGENPELIKSKKFQNTFTVQFDTYNQNENIYHLFTKENIEIKISNHSKLLNKQTERETRIQLSLRPTDIALSLDKQEGTTIQNQLQGTVKKIIRNNEGVFCIIDCGFEIFVEISEGIIHNLYLHEGQEIYCQIKANDFDVVHVFDKIKEELNSKLEIKHSEGIYISEKI
jgi:ABC-type molybdate transport system ATPase subunit